FARSQFPRSHRSSPGMSKIQVRRTHNLGVAGARTEVERIARRVQDDYGADCAWHGDTLWFSRSGVNGQITVSDTDLDLTIKLGLLYSAMKGQIEDRIVAKLDQNLARHLDGGATCD
ncbi:MAG: polyhydroxyalkanoic acid system family protein, partial [Thiohalocapsa sp.]